MTNHQCAFDECPEPDAKPFRFEHDSTDYEIDVCAEHRHDIDWGVTTTDELLKLVHSGESAEPGTAELHR